VKLSLPDDLGPTNMLSPDGSVLLVGTYEGRIFICDVHTGKLRQDTVAGGLGDYMPLSSFSPDGQYFWSCEGNSLHVIETASTKTVLDIPGPQAHDFPRSAIFAPDGSALAVLWLVDGMTLDCVQIVDLLNGKERCRFSLPPDLEAPCFSKWVGNRLYVAGELPVPSTDEARHVWYVFDVSGTSMGQATAEPPLSAPSRNHERNLSGWLDGLDWVAHVALVRLEPTGMWDEWRGWLLHRLRGINDPSFYFQVTLFDRETGRERRSLRLYKTVVVMPWITNDGKRLACILQNGTIEVWDTDPPLRWPWAVLAGIGSAGLVLLLGRWASRRQEAVLAE
jgi:WD40 repeat protein